MTSCVKCKAPTWLIRTDQISSKEHADLMQTVMPICLIQCT